MLTSISSFPFSPQKAFSLISSFVHSPSSILSERIKLFAAISFKAFSGSFLIGQGSWVIYRREDEKKTAIENVLQIPHVSHAVLHGSLLIGSGVCSILQSIHSLSKRNIVPLFSAFNGLGNALFFFANLVALEENINLYDHYEKEDTFSRQMRKSALSGILSNLGYITAIIIATFGSWTAIAFLIGIVSAFFGTLKIIYANKSL